MKTKTLTLKINNVPGYSGTVAIDVDKNGTPLQKFWRKRMKEAEADNCVEVVKASASKKDHDK